MRVLILGGDGYLGWPTAMRLAARGDEVTVADNYLHRALASETGSTPLLPVPELPERAAVFHSVAGREIRVEIGDCTDQAFVDHIVQSYQPDAVVHYAEQPSAPYSMMGYGQAKRTLENNLGPTFAVIWAVMRHAPDCHIVKLGTMGEYGTPDIDIEEGWIDIEHKGRSDRFLYPRQGGSLYHTTKILDSDLLWFYVRTHVYVRTPTARSAQPVAARHVGSENGAERAADAMAEKARRCCPPWESARACAIRCELACCRQRFSSAGSTIRSAAFS